MMKINHFHFSTKLNLNSLRYAITVMGPPQELQLVPAVAKAGTTSCQVLDDYSLLLNVSKYVTRIVK